MAMALFGYCAATANADSVMLQEQAATPTQQAAHDELGDEYKKLLRIIESKKAPIQTIDGTLNIAGRPGMGPVDSDVILIEFGDFQCPFCKRHLKDAAQEIYRNLVLTDKLRYVYLDYPAEIKHPFAKKAAIAARCAEEQGKYWEMRNTLFNNQKALQEIFLVEHAKNAGMNEAKFSDCFQSGRYASSIKEDQVVGRSLGIKGTPTFFIGINRGDEVRIIRKIQGVQPYEDFEREILKTKEIALSEQREESINKMNLSSN
jgi:protein-disulfide isomerase